MDVNKLGDVMLEFAMHVSNLDNLVSSIIDNDKGQWLSVRGKNENESWNVHSSVLSEQEGVRDFLKAIVLFRFLTMLFQLSWLFQFHGVFLVFKVPHFFSLEV